MRRYWVAAGAGLAFFALVGATQLPEAQARGTVLSVTGRGVVTVPNNRVTVSAGLETSGDTASQAIAANRAIMARLFVKLAALGIAKDAIQTSGISLSPLHDSGDSKRITGYRMENTISISFDKIDTSGNVLDALVEQGANRIQGPSIRLVASPEQINAARAAAMRDVRARADLYAKATGLSVRRIVSIRDGSDYASPVAMSRMAVASDTVIAGGQGSVSIAISADFELG